MLLLTSAEFREHDGDDLVQVFAELHRDAVARAGWRGGIGALLAELPRLLRLAWLTRRDAGRASPVSDTRYRNGRMLETLAQDLRYAIRAMRRAPGFTAIAVLTLALGIGANTAIFSVVNGVLLRSLPYDEPDRLVMVWRHGIDDPLARGSMSGPDIDDVRELDAVSAIEGIATTTHTLTGGSNVPELVEAGTVTGGLIAAFGLRPLLGRDLTHEDDLRGSTRVAVVGYDFWQSRLGGNRDVIGTTIELSERSYEIVGVAPAGFRFPIGGAFGAEGVQLWTAHLGIGKHAHDNAVSFGRSGAWRRMCRSKAHPSS